MIVFVDIDHVICDRSHREAEFTGGNWDDYHRLSIDDAPIESMIELVNALAEDDHSVIGFSSRHERWRKVTNEWLIKNDVNLSELIMRRNDDFRPAKEIKRELVESSLLKDFGGVSLMIDDRENDFNVTTLVMIQR